MAPGAAGRRGAHHPGDGVAEGHDGLPHGRGAPDDRELVDKVAHLDVHVEGREDERREAQGGALGGDGEDPEGEGEGGGRAREHAVEAHGPDAGARGGGVGADRGDAVDVAGELQDCREEAGGDGGRGAGEEAGAGARGGGGGVADAGLGGDEGACAGRGRPRSRAAERRDGGLCRACCGARTNEAEREGEVHPKEDHADELGEDLIGGGAAVGVSSRGAAAEPLVRRL